MPAVTGQRQGYTPDKLLGQGDTDRQTSIYTPMQGCISVAPYELVKNKRIFNKRVREGKDMFKKKNLLKLYQHYALNWIELNWKRA